MTVADEPFLARMELLAHEREELLLAFLATIGGSRWSDAWTKLLRPFVPATYLDTAPHRELPDAWIPSSGAVCDGQSAVRVTIEPTGQVEHGESGRRRSTKPPAAALEAMLTK